MLTSSTVSPSKISPISIRNLVFQGGSVRGIAYLGAIKALTKQGVKLSQIERVAGTSAGAINALLLSLGFNVTELEQLMQQIDFKDFLDGRAEVTRSKVLSTADKVTQGYPTFYATVPAKTVAPLLAYQLHKAYGVFEGNYLLEWAEKVLIERTGIANITFKELHDFAKANPDKGFKDLYVLGANISLGLSQVFSWETTPNVVVSNAVRISMSIPWVFKPCVLLEKNKQNALVPDKNNHIWVDGGILDNYPINIFDNACYLNANATAAPAFNTQTLGFRLVDKAKKKFFEGSQDPSKNDIESLLQFSLAVLNTIKDKQESDHNLSNNKQRTIYIDTVGVNMLNFGINDLEKQSLLIAGEAAVEGYFTGEEPDYVKMIEKLKLSAQNTETSSKETKSKNIKTLDDESPACMIS